MSSAILLSLAIYGGVFKAVKQGSLVSDYCPLSTETSSVRLGTMSEFKLKTEDSKLIGSLNYMEFFEGLSFLALKAFL